MRQDLKRWLLILGLVFTCLVVVICRDPRIPAQSSPSALPSRALSAPLSIGKPLPQVATSLDLKGPPHTPVLSATARVLAEEREARSGSAFLRVQVMSDPVLRYPVRTEQLLEKTPGGIEIPVRSLEMAAGHVLARLQPGVKPETVLAALRSAGVVAVRALKANGLVRLELSEATPRAVPRALLGVQTAQNLLTYAEPDYLVHTTETQPNDPEYVAGQLWGLRNTGQSGGVSDSDIDADEAWDTRTDASNIIVAIVDTGVRYTHEDLADNMWVNPGEIPGDGIDNDHNGIIDDVHGFNAINQTGDPMDDYGHGTHVAGTIGARGNNGTGVAGIAWRVQLMPVKFLSSNGSGFTSDGIEAIDYARQMGAHIMNNSYGSGGFSQSLADAIERTRQAGIIFVASAGNNGVSCDLAPSFPAAYPHDNIVSVASSTRTDELSSFSNYGLRTVDLAAPGSAIFSTFNTSDSAYATLSGTSMASPHVAGAFALVKAQFPSATYSELIDRVLATTDHPTNFLQRVRSQGRLNLARALTTPTINPLPSIIEHPRSSAVMAGGLATFKVIAQGGAPLVYQWRHNGFDLAGADQATLTRTNVQSVDTGRYSVLVSNASGLALSEEAFLTISLPVSILTQPEGATLPVDGTFTSEVKVGGDPPFTYQWRKNGSNLPGATSSAFRIYGVTSVDAGAYSVRVSNAVSSVTSTAAMLTVISPPLIAAEPTDQTAVIGGSATFTVAASGTMPLSLQWFKDGTMIGGANSSTLSLKNIQAATVGSYAARVTNTVGIAWSVGASLTVKTSAGGNGVPQFTQHPIDQTANAGETVTFNGAANPRNVTYQWRKDGTPIIGATSATIMVTNLNTTKIGVYTLIASNAQGIAASHGARLTVRQAPTILQQPRSITAVPGADVVLEVTASGTEPISYQWHKDGIPLSGTTGRRLFLASVGVSQTGTYTVKVFNPAGSATSLPAVVSLSTATIGAWRQVDPRLDMHHQWCVGGAPDGIYLAGYDGVFSFSPDGGRTWNRHRSGVGPGREITGIAYANGKYVAIGSETNIPFSLTSVDGTNWTRHSSVLYYGRTWLLHHDGAKFYTANYSYFCTSVDGIGWTLTPFGAPQALTAVAKGSGRFVAVGPQGTIYTSTSGTAWGPASSGITQQLNGVCYGGPAGYVAVGENGAVVISSNGLAWTQPPAITSQMLNSIAFGNGRYVAVGGSGVTGFQQPAVTLVSTNGRTWRRTSNHAVDNLATVEFVKGIFVAAGGSGQVLTSEDGESWTGRGSEDPQRLYGIAQGNDVFVAVGDAGVIRNSQDGLTWVTERPGRSENLHSIGFGDGQFVAGADDGTLYISSDATAWQPQKLGAGVVSCVRYINDRFFVLTDSGEILISPDVGSWTLSPPVTGAPLKHIAWNGTQYVIAGYDGTILTSIDGQRWTAQSTPTRLHLSGVAWGGSQFVAVGVKGTVLTSRDGTNWVAGSAGTNAALTGVAYGNGLFVAAGAQGLILTSPNGVTWAPQNSRTGQYFTRVEFLNGSFVASCGGNVAHSADGTNWSVVISNILEDVAFGNGLYVGVGYSGRLFVSQDLSSWLWRGLGSLTSYVLTDVKFQGGQFVACGRNGNILTSKDGKDWTLQNSGFASGLEKMAYGAGRHIIVGINGIILHSPDGVTWSRVVVPGVDQWDHVTFGGGQFVAVGWPGAIATSTNGIDWVKRASPTGTQLNRVAYGNNIYVAVGFSGEILASPDGIYWAAPYTDTYGVDLVIFSSGQFVAIDELGRVLTSTDGMTWNFEEGDTSLRIVGLFDYEGAIFAVGDFGLITVLAAPPEIMSQPISQQVRVGAPVSLSGMVTNPGPPQFQWFKNGEPVVGATGPTIFWRRVGSSDGGEYFLRASGLGGAVDSIRAMLTVTEQPFDTWRITLFGENIFLDPMKENTIWGSFADPDNDKLPNIAEYALGLSPLEATHGSPLTAEVAAGHLRVTYTRRKNDPALQIIPQVSSDLLTWYDGPSYIQEVAITPINAELERVTLVDTQNSVVGVPRFLRLKLNLLE
jgi:subtilisin family serine protease